MGGVCGFYNFTSCGSSGTYALTAHSNPCWLFGMRTHRSGSCLPGADAPVPSICPAAFVYPFYCHINSWLTPNWDLTSSKKLVLDPGGGRERYVKHGTLTSCPSLTHSQANAIRRGPLCRSVVVLRTGQCTVGAGPWTLGPVYKSCLLSGLSSAQSTTRIFSSDLRAQHSPSQPTLHSSLSIPTLHRQPCPASSSPPCPPRAPPSSLVRSLQYNYGSSPDESLSDFLPMFSSGMPYDDQ